MLKLSLSQFFEEEKTYGMSYKFSFVQKKKSACVLYYIQGRKIPIDEYVTRIRTARNADSSKPLKTTQYLTHNQVFYFLVQSAVSNVFVLQVSKPK